VSINPYPLPSLTLTQILTLKPNLNLTLGDLVWCGTSDPGHFGSKTFWHQCRNVRTFLVYCEVKRHSISILRLRECGGGRQKVYTNPPVRDELAQPPEWNMIWLYVRSAAHDVAHCSPQMTRSTRLTTAITHTSTIGSDSGLLLLQLIRPIV